MGFFKEFKDDLGDAVDEMVPDQEKDNGKKASSNDDVMVNTLDEDVDVDSELSKLDGLLESASKKVDSSSGTENTLASENLSDDASNADSAPAAEPSLNDPADLGITDFKPAEPEKKAMDTTQNTFAPANSGAVSDETAEITAGMTITGDLDSTGSINVEGTIQGNVKCNGKLVVTGTVRGNSNSSEFFADSAKIEGEVVTAGTAKVGSGSVIIGNITASSAVIAGAVKGDIDVQGPVVVDTSAVIMGNIKSRSVQINNGAVIQGFCSQEYADVDVESVFEDAQ